MLTPFQLPSFSYGLMPNAETERNGHERGENRTLRHTRTPPSLRRMLSSSSVQSKKNGTALNVIQTGSKRTIRTNFGKTRLLVPRLCVMLPSPVNPIGHKPDCLTASRISAVDNPSNRRIDPCSNKNVTSLFASILSPGPRRRMLLDPSS